MRLHEAASIENDAKFAITVSDAIMDMLAMVTQSHIWHLQTKSYAAHKALGDFYEALQEKLDGVAETFMGAGGQLRTLRNNELVPFDKSNTINLLTEFRNKLNNLQAELMEKENSAFHSVGDGILEIVQETDKLLYLLSLE